MIFGAVPLERAEGLILAHTMLVDGHKLIKGRRLGADDLDALRAAGLSEVTGCMVGPGDLDENEAAREVAQALAGEGVKLSPASTGRCNLFSRHHGVLAIDAERIGRLNRVDEAVTTATAQPWSVVEPGQRVATVKIIPFAVEAGIVHAAIAAAGTTPIRIHPFRPRPVGLVLTAVPTTSQADLDGAAAVARQRVEGLGGRLGREVRCPHNPEALEQAIPQALEGGCELLLISGALVTTDRRDMVPDAIVRAGGAIIHFGMPAEPGNMLLLARIGEVPVLVLPSCARSQALNGLDLILRRIMADIPVSPRSVMEMGVGGLLD
ncbi:Molybdopterin biosynthesis protein [Magnetospirillum sp. XM-1]|uniref:molybdopterin-binding protein n=1 Tax=Magnetospirillum sp. XM-1 TaxID=1663591 RepID=UPI00073DF144|nr:molybdopterin-binding protein [Magnetospirillum sp. XM-1]CUW40880.1 Molybdopterin biosynthesis protein [Magnetospirillum sp. XM-1]